ncbi:MAG: hypothetical protein Q8O59_04040 [bacterium]|nr:hypothetical protein [bacterium]
MIEEKFFSPIQESRNDNFNKEKKIVLDFLDREAKGEVGSRLYKHEGRLDDNIRGLVAKINQLLFLYTEQACGGHIITAESMRAKHPEAKYLQLPPPNKSIYIAGNIDFETDGDSQSEIFISRLKDLISQFDGITLFDPREIKDPKYHTHLPYTLKFGKNVGRRSIDIEQVQALELNKEKFMFKLEKLIDEFIPK